MRVESNNPTKNGGWLHRLSDPMPMYQPKPAIPDRIPDLKTMWERWEANKVDLEELAEGLGVDTDALRAIGCVWASGFGAWAFPMKDASGRLIGIRLRDQDGRKWSVKGSRSGLFIPTEYLFVLGVTLYLVEGPTDLAAAMTLGLYAIGRPACLGQEEIILEYVKVNRIKRVVIITDNDEPGLRGARKLQALLPVHNCVWVPPAKDLREFLNRGGNQTIVRAAIKDLVWEQPRIAA